MLVRFTFDAHGSDRLTLAITADDYCKVSLNGELLGVGPAQGYADCYHFNAYALSGALRDGKNVIAVHVFYMGTLTRAWQSDDERQGLWMELRDETGKVRGHSSRDCRVFFPTAWREKGLLGYQTQFIEEVFAADIPEGWTLPDFDDTQWAHATETPLDDHVLLALPTRPVALYEQRPALVEKRGDTWFADMGAEVVGTVKARISAKGGGTITFRMGEELNDDGSVMCPMRCNCDYRLTWHLSGRDTDETDFFDYMAFRYIEVDDPENRVDPQSLSVTVRHYPMQSDVGLFHSESPLADDIFRICRRAVMLSAQEAFLDCPSREKGQYLGDGTITVQSHLLLTGDKAMYRKMLFDFAASSRICPGLMPVVDGLEDYFDHYRNEQGLIESLTEKWNLVDWPDNLRDGYDFALTQPIGPGAHNVINAFYYGLKRDADRLRALLGQPERGEAEALRQRYMAAFRRENGLFRDAVGSEHTALHSVVLPLYYGITAPEDIPAAVALIREKGLCCGVYMAYFVLKALARNGEYALLTELLFSQDIHSWGNMLREGATTCWEAWGHSQKWNTSLCHPWASAPVILMLQDLAGIYPAKPGFAEIGMSPHMPEWLGDIDLSLGTVRGVIAAKRVSGQWSLTLNGQPI